MTDGDTKALFKMMERGELDPNVALPKFWKLLGEEAQPFMEEYFKSIEYARRRVAVESEQWFKAFMGNGAVEGVTEIFSSLATTMGSARGSAELFGKTVRNLGYILSGALLIPKELKEWLRGESKHGNLFDHLFGEFDFKGMGELGDTLKNLSSILTNIATSIGMIHTLLRDWKVYSMAGTVAEGAVGIVAEATGFVNALTSGTVGDGGVLDYRYQQRAKALARREIENRKKSGFQYSKEEEDKLFKELYEAQLNAFREAYSKKGTLGKVLEQASGQVASVIAAATGIDTMAIGDDPEHYLNMVLTPKATQLLLGNLYPMLHGGTAIPENADKEFIMSLVKGGNKDAANYVLQFPTLFPEAAKFVRDQEGKQLPYYKGSNIEVAQEALGSLPNYIPAYGDMEGLSNYFADMYNSNNDLRRSVELSIAPVPSTVTNNVEVNITTTEGMSPEDVGDEVRETIVSMFSTTIPVTSFS